MARRSSTSERFSTTVTWNCRGKARIAEALSSVITSQVAGELPCEIAETTRSSLRMASKTGPGPSNRNSTTAPPTSRNTAILTSDSSATARISPSWCSVASAWRVPNRIAKTDRNSATISEMSTWKFCCAVSNTS
jgi:hypothetical protein